MEIKDFKVGQTVYLRPVGNALRNTDGAIKEETIETVGKKYLTLKNYYRMKFGYYGDRIRDISEYSANYILYTSLQEIEDEKLNAELSRKVQNYRFTFEELKKINELFFQPPHTIK